MAIIQAYKRTKPYTYDPVGHEPLHFKPNESGHVVCDVKEQAVIVMLLAVPSGFRVYMPKIEAALATGTAPEAPTMSAVLLPVEALPDDPPPAEPEPEPEAHEFVLVNSAGSSVDLRTFNDVQLRTFGEANGIKLHHKAKGDTLRTAIAAALAVAGD